LILITLKFKYLQLMMYTFTTATTHRLTTQNFGPKANLNWTKKVELKRNFVILKLITYKT